MHPHPSLPIEGLPPVAEGRREYDAYYTSDRLAEVLVGELIERSFLHPSQTALDPHCGGGSFLRSLGHYLPPGNIQGTDIDPTARGLSSSVLEPQVGLRRAFDFLKPWPAEWRRPHWIVGNPPYCAAELHVRQALQVARVGVAFLLRLGFLGSASRHEFWQEMPARRIWVLSERPSFTSGATDSQEYALFVWRRAPSRRSSPALLEVLSWR